MGRLKILINESSESSYWNRASEIVLNGEWKKFIWGIVMDTYRPLSRTIFNDKRYEGATTIDGKWHGIINRINTNIKLWARLIEYYDLDPNNPSLKLIEDLKSLVIKDIDSLFSEDGELYLRFVVPIITNTVSKGEETETKSVELLDGCPIFNGLTIEKVGGDGVGIDMSDGVDVVAYQNVITIPTYTIQVKPFSGISEGRIGHFIDGIGKGNIKGYSTNFIAFVNGSKIILADSKKCKLQKNGSYLILNTGIKWQRGNDLLNEDLDIIRNILKFI